MSPIYYYVSHEMAHFILLSAQWANQEGWGDDRIMSHFNNHFHLQWTQAQMADTFMALRRNYGPFPQQMEYMPWYDIVPAELSSEMDVDEGWSEEEYMQGVITEGIIEDGGEESRTGYASTESYLADDSSDADEYAMTDEDYSDGMPRSSYTSLTLAGVEPHNGNIPWNQEDSTDSESSRESKNNDQNFIGNAKHQNGRNRGQHNGAKPPQSNDRKPQQNPAQGPRTTCTNCSKVGHAANDCRSRQSRKCNSCGKTGHVSKDCRSNQTCDKCGKAGHLSSACRSNTGGANGGRGGHGGRGHGKPKGRGGRGH